MDSSHEILHVLKHAKKRTTIANVKTTRIPQQKTVEAKLRSKTPKPYLSHTTHGADAHINFPEIIYQGLLMHILETIKTGLVRQNKKANLFFWNETWALSGLPLLDS